MSLTYPEAIVVGLFQGVTELFPVSSLGHSVIIPALIGGRWAPRLETIGNPFQCDGKQLGRKRIDTTEQQIGIDLVRTFERNAALLDDDGTGIEELPYMDAHRAPRPGSPSESASIAWTTLVSGHREVLRSARDRKPLCQRLASDR